MFRRESVGHGGRTDVIIALVTPEVERSQPYVVAYMEPSEASKMFIDFVVKNYGLTAARNVVIQIDPAPRRSFDGEEVAIPSTVPILAPGQEWRSSGQQP